MQTLLKTPYSQTTLRFWQGVSIFVIFVVALSARSALAAGPRLSNVNLHDFRFGGTKTAEQTPLATAEESAPAPTPRLTAKYTLTSYTSIAALTDGSPFITANGSHVHMGTVAANCLAFGTEIKIPALFGDQIFTVEDRLNARKGCGIIDVWLPTYAEAKQFGVKFTKVEIF